MFAILNCQSEDINSYRRSKPDGAKATHIFRPPVVMIGIAAEVIGADLLASWCLAASGQ
jgi:hypothetical protein